MNGPIVWVDGVAYRRNDAGDLIAETCAECGHPLDHVHEKDGSTACSSCRRMKLMHGTGTG